MRTQTVRKAVTIAAILALAITGFTATGIARGRNQDPQPVPDVPKQVCPECLVDLQATIFLRDQLLAIHAQQAELRKKIADNQTQQEQAKEEIKDLETALASQDGQGGTVVAPDGTRT